MQLCSFDTNRSSKHFHSLGTDGDGIARLSDHSFEATKEATKETWCNKGGKIVCDAFANNEHKLLTERSFERLLNAFWHFALIG